VDLGLRLGVCPLDRQAAPTATEMRKMIKDRGDCMQTLSDYCSELLSTFFLNVHRCAATCKAARQVSGHAGPHPSPHPKNGHSRALCFFYLFRISCRGHEHTCNTTTMQGRGPPPALSFGVTPITEEVPAVNL
jgi:hypothetical protein